MQIFVYGTGYIPYPFIRPVCNEALVAVLYIYVWDECRSVTLDTPV